MCPYVETYPQGWLFAVRAVCKLVRDAANGIIGVAPYTSMVDAVWAAAFSFPNDEWPDTSTKMWVCVGLNISIYIVFLLMLAGLVHGWIYFLSFYSAHFVILQPLTLQTHHINVLLKRSYVPTGTMRTRRRKDFDANLD